MKTYSNSYTPSSVMSLLAIRKIDCDKVAQAIDATLTGLAFKAEFTGLVKAKGEKGEHNAVTENVARMPAGTIKDVLVWYGDIHRAEKTCKRAGGVFTLSDIRPTVNEWFTSFSIPAAGAPAPQRRNRRNRSQSAPAVIPQVKAVETPIAPIVATGATV